MTNTIDFILTTAANELIFKVLSGKTLNFTRMAVGDGFSYDTNVAKNYTALVNEVLSLDITKVETSSLSSVRVTSAFKNTDAEKEFYYREVGLYAQDPDTGKEILYAYGNRNDAAELITPSESSVITKQLIFIISVGDSANVTFNVNADVYALQEDMLNVQENKANKNLVNTGMITNCLLEIPQNVKMQLLGNTLTILAGTKAYFPNGFEADGTTKKFDVVILSNDIVVNVSTEDKTFVTGLNNTSSTYRTIAENVFSQATEPVNPANLSIWYDTTNNIIKRYVNGSWSGSQLSLPLGITTWKNGLCTSIDQVFNGVGYIGSTIWVDKGIKGLTPNGRNTDGTLKNIEWEQSSLHLRTFDNDESYKVILGLDGNELSRVFGSYSYDDTTNFNYTILGIWYYTLLGTCTLTKGVISNFEMIKPFRLVNYYNYLQRLEELESRISALETN